MKRLRVQLGVEHAHVEAGRRRDVWHDDVEVIDLGRVDRQHAALWRLCPGTEPQAGSDAVAPQTGHERCGVRLWLVFAHGRQIVQHARAVAERVGGTPSLSSMRQQQVRHVRVLRELQVTAALAAGRTRRRRARSAAG